MLLKKETWILKKPFELIAGNLKGKADPNTKQLRVKVDGRKRMIFG